jgi:glycosyltransferase involved in cell wall biosynthesis
MYSPSESILASTELPAGLDLVVVIPCYNEELTIGKVVSDFRQHLPTATVYVYDNNSSDNTAAIARAAGAVVRSERRQGKGHVVQRMFADIDADVYVMVDGDDTYDASFAPELVRRLLTEGLDFVNGSRVSNHAASYRPGHRFGNKLLSRLVANIFGSQFTDMLSGYKVFSRRFVKCFPTRAKGFEIETELTVHALELRMPCAEMATSYGERPDGSFSKLQTWRDGWRILVLIANLIRNERPLQFFGTMSLVLFVLGVTIDIPILITYLHTGLVPRLPTALLSVGMIILSVLMLMAGLILDLVATARFETKRLTYLRLDPPTGNNRRR